MTCVSSSLVVSRVFVNKAAGPAFSLKAGKSEARTWLLFVLFCLVFPLFKNILEALGSKGNICVQYVCVCVCTCESFFFVSSGKSASVR